jgi:hypothetical protein
MASSHPASTKAITRVSRLMVIPRGLKKLTSLHLRFSMVFSWLRWRSNFWLRPDRLFPAIQLLR